MEMEGASNRSTYFVDPDLELLLAGYTEAVHNLDAKGSPGGRGPRRGPVDARGLDDIMPTISVLSIPDHDARVKWSASEPPQR